MPVRVVTFSQSPAEILEWLRGAVVRLEMPKQTANDGTWYWMSPILEHRDVVMSPNAYDTVVGQPKPPQGHPLICVKAMRSVPWTDDQRKAERDRMERWGLGPGEIEYWLEDWKPAYHYHEPVISFQLHPLLGRGWEAAITYEVAIEAWIDTLQRDAGDQWIVDAPTESPEEEKLPPQLVGRDRMMVVLWRKGHACGEIGQAHGLTEKSVFNRIGDLRRIFGEDVVPLRRKRRADNDW